MKDKVLFMTACINPSGMPNTALQSVSLRKKQDMEAINYYLANTKYRILFVENSGVDISSYFLEEIKTGRMEFLTFEGNDFDKKLGKGYGEGLIVRYALQNSKLLHADSMVIKVSGRHIVTNLSKIENLSNVFCGKNGYVVCDINPKTRGANSDLFISSVDFLWLFEKNIEMINEESHIWFEHVLYKTIVQYCNMNGKFIYLPLPLRQVGVSGSMGTSFKKPSLLLCIKHLIKFFFYEYKKGKI